MAARALDAHPAPVTLRLPFAAPSVAVARRGIQRWLTDAGAVRPTVDDARIVISEMVANAVRHARPLPDGTLSVSWGLGDSGLEVVVADGGAPTRPHRVDAGRSAMGGRGMAIVDGLASSWWTERTPSRSSVHAVLPLYTA